MHTIESPRVSGPWLVVLGAVLCAAPCARAATQQRGPPPLDAVASRGEADPAAPRGLVVREPEAAPGYTLVAPLSSTTVHLIDLAGEVVHTWQTGSAPGAWCYLLDDGSLLHAGREDESTGFRGGGIGGRLRRFAPDGTLVWSHDLADGERHQHHDLEPLANGNLLVIAWERKSAEEAIARGRLPQAVGAAGLWPDVLYELRPTLPEGAEVVWEWHVWDHIVQDVDPEKPGYGALADHPGRIDVNAGFVPEEDVSLEERKQRLELEDQMAALGYAGGDDDPEPDDAQPPREKRDEDGDWMHVNSVDVHEELDLVVISSPELGELYAIDRSTTSAEAAGSRGGRWGRGGEILWRWGNPAVHGVGTDAQRRLYYQHDPTWIGGADDLRVLVFNNGRGRPDGDYSSVEELVLPFDAERGFTCAVGAACAPEAPAWSYVDRDGFYSAFISGAQRLANGHTLICSGTSGRLFEVTRDKRIVWEYRNLLGEGLEAPEHAGQAPKQALFRGTRLAPDHPGVRALLAAER